MTPTNEKDTVSFKDTLNLPHTDFPIRPNAQVDDTQVLERWHNQHLYEKAFTHNKGKATYILHDGPPYANGHIHLGSAYNKILKDIITKYRRMRGYHVPVTPGWDCHGLPIELKVSKENPGISPYELKKACRAYAEDWVHIQREEFKRLGIIMHWDKPYITMAPTYEAAIMRAFGMCLQKGFIERKNKTVPWCYSCGTVLASAEIEYKDRKDPSIYVLFELEPVFVDKYIQQLIGTPVYMVIWTTTPWTLPLNRGILLNLHETYQIRYSNGTYFIIGKTVHAQLDQQLGCTTQLITEVPASLFTHAYAQHPFVHDLTVPFIFDDSVSVHEGTAAIHVAPGCGPIDYEIGIKNNLEIFSPVSSNGRYTSGIKPAELEGMSVHEGQEWVIRTLTASNKLLCATTIYHAYPHCWRCHSGLIFRATRQWFLNLTHRELKQRAIQALSTLQFLPQQGYNFLKATIENRWEWCLSRQRIWGVPIPAFLCTSCDYIVISPELVEKVASGVAREGIEYWDTVDTADLLSSKLQTCPNCPNQQLVKEQDILDVWFDSGISHYAVLVGNPELAYPADIYAEGVDQHRGWFQSSLLTSLILEEQPCTRTILTHGFTVDATGQKMSKSLGNVIAPQEIITQLGTDGLRLWAASIDHEGDAPVSPVLLQNVGEVYRKIRNTARFLLSNLYDFEISRDQVSFDQLLLIDQYALERLYELQNSILAAYEQTHITAVFHELSDYCAAELSSFYLDSIKDRLYVESAQGRLRRSAQTVCWYILDALTKLIAPILSFTAELLSDYYQQSKAMSIHLQDFAQLESIYEHLQRIYTQDTSTVLRIGNRNPQWQFLKSLRSTVLKALESLRADKIIKQSLEARVTLFLDTNNQDVALLESLFARAIQNGQSREEFLKELFIVSQVTLAATKTDLESTALDGVFLSVSKAEGTKCPRCWQWDITEHIHGLCKRCQKVLNQ